LDCIRDNTGRHLADARTSRHRTAAAQLALRSEALRSTRLATAMVLGAANEMIDEVHRQRVARATELKRTLADSAKRRRVLTRKWLNVESAARKTSAVKNRRQRLVCQTALHNDVAAMRKKYRAFLASLTKERCASEGIWYSQAAGGFGAASVRRESAQAAKREAEAMVKREAEATARREAEATAKREAEAKAKREAASSMISGHKSPA
jgi:hypothetical protein